MENPSGHDHFFRCNGCSKSATYKHDEGMNVASELFNSGWCLSGERMFCRGCVGKMLARCTSDGIDGISRAAGVFDDIVNELKAIRKLVDSIESCTPIKEA